MEKKTLLAVILSVLVIIGYQFYTAKYYPAPVDTGPSAPAVVNEKFAEENAGELTAPSAAEPEISNAPAMIITKETDKYLVTLSTAGGCITGITLKDHAAIASDKGFELINIKDTKNGIFNMEGLSSQRLARTNFTAAEKADEVDFTAKIGGKLELTKKYIFHKSSYVIDLETYIHNTTGDEINGGYVITAASDIGFDSPIDKRYIQGIAEINGKVKKSGGSKDPIMGNINYAGLQDRYFSVIAKNNVPSEEVMIKKLDDGTISAAIKISGFTILPDSMVSHKFSLYAGPTDMKIMTEYGLATAASQGLLGGISDLLLAALNLFHKIFRNWGIAIILLSILVNLILFPLSRKSYESMKKIQHIQPHMDKLREEHKDNPNKLNKEMMELYKKYDVNPMGGCLPLLLQIPVFIALYQALMKSLELRGSAFLWVKDLSMPDAVPLPFSLPLVGHAINILPILMTIAMVFQQRFSTAKGAAQNAQQKQQQQMMVIMPVVFLFVMYSFPSGLVLYWLVNTILTTFEQRAIMHG